jgi:hypothetical protein
LSSTSTRLRSTPYRWSFPAIALSCLTRTRPGPTRHRGTTSVAPNAPGRASCLASRRCARRGSRMWSGCRRRSTIASVT